MIEPGKLPLLVCFAAFVITFLTTRGTMRAIRAGHGPFHNISDGATHIHHAVPGIFSLIAGAFLAVDSAPHSATAVIAAVAVGIGTSLVLDEFALILNLQDDYWTAEGRVSGEMVSLAFGCLGFLLVGVAPFKVNRNGSARCAWRAPHRATAPDGWSTPRGAPPRSTHVGTPFSTDSAIWWPANRQKLIPLRRRRRRTITSIDEARRLLVGVLGRRGEML